MQARFGGLVIDSEIPLTDLPPTSGPADIVIRTGAVDAKAGELIQEWPGAGGQRWLAIFSGDRGYRVSVAGLECALSRDGRAITVQPAPALADAALVHLLLQQVLPLAVSRTGRLVMHACAVDTPAGALAFVGESGAGKSTLAGAFCRRGHPLIADDALVMELEEEGIRVSPTADALRLWPDQREVAAGAETALSASGKLRARVTLARAPSRLARVYLLGTAPDASSSVTMVPTAEMRVSMLSHMFRLDVTDRDESRRVFDAVHRVVDMVPVRRAVYPDGLEHLDAAVDAILRDSISPT